jgi:hypothetical protein
MATLPQILIVLGAAVFGLLGAMHLFYTFFTNKFDARDPTASAAMKATSPVLTRRTSLWNAWIGFNASHSLGALLFAAIYLILASEHMLVLRDSPALAWLPVAGSAAYLVVARRYWFRSPLVGIAISGACFLAAAVSLSL